MPRVSQADLHRVAATLSRMTNAKLFIQYAYGRPRLMELIDEKTGAVRDVSPRLSSGPLMQWMEGFYTGVDYALRPLKRRR